MPSEPESPDDVKWTWEEILVRSFHPFGRPGPIVPSEREVNRWQQDFAFVRRRLVATRGEVSDPMIASIDRMIAAIDSMTTRERSEPALIDESRIERISAGSGTDADVIRGMLMAFFPAAVR